MAHHRRVGEVPRARRTVLRDAGGRRAPQLAAMVDTFAPLELGQAGLACEDDAYDGTRAGRGPARSGSTRWVADGTMGLVPSYVAFLRAINLGATRKFPMAELRGCLEADGFAAVETHINTGNVRLGCRQRSTEAVRTRLEAVFANDRGFVVPTVVLTPAELARTYADALALPAPARDAPRRYVTLLREPTAGEGADGAAALDAWDGEGEGLKVVGRAVHWWLDGPMHESRLSNALVERHLGVATTRDLNVIRTLAERWAPPVG